MLTPELLELMPRDQALHALHCELGTDFDWLINWFENTLEEARAEGVAEAPEYDLSEGEIRALSGACMGSATDTVALLTLLAEHTIETPAELLEVITTADAAALGD